VRLRNGARCLSTGVVVQSLQMWQVGFGMIGDAGAKECASLDA
jgi:hypothetical protein